MLSTQIDASNLQDDFCDMLKINRLRISLISNIPSRWLHNLLILAVPSLIEKIHKSARLLAVGIDWAILPTAFIIPILVARIRNEERVLEGDLKGYRDYLQHTRYRLLPGLW